MISLTCGNCIEELKKLSDNSIDITITSPPYNMNLRIRNGKYCSRQIVKEISTKYNEYPDNLSMDEYFNFNKTIIDELLRVSKLTFYNIQIVTGNKPALFRLLGHFSEKIKEVIIWDKVNSQPAMQVGVLNSRYELLLVLSNDSISRQFQNAVFNRGTLENLWQVKRGKKISKEHGAVFPEELVEKILINFSTEHQVVLDPMCGTGTTGYVCKKLNRNFIGFDISEKYIKIAEERINGNS